MMKINNILGFATLLIAHITFNLPYVILSVMPKLKQMDPNLREAALDLGLHAVAGVLQGRYPRDNARASFPALSWPSP